MFELGRNDSELAGGETEVVFTISGKTTKKQQHFIHSCTAYIHLNKEKELN